MAIVHPASEMHRTMMSARAMATTMFPPTTSREYELDLGAPLVKAMPERITEPLRELDPPLDEVNELLLSDDEGIPDLDALEDIPGRVRRSHVTATRQATGAEDAFQSYLRDIRGLGCSPMQKKLT